MRVKDEWFMDMYGTDIMLPGCTTECFSGDGNHCADTCMCGECVDADYRMKYRLMTRMVTDSERLREVYVMARMGQPPQAIAAFMDMSILSVLTAIHRVNAMIGRTNRDNKDSDYLDSL